MLTEVNRNIMSDIAKTIEDQALKSDKFIDSFFDNKKSNGKVEEKDKSDEKKTSGNKKEDKSKQKAKAKNSVNELKSSLLKCKSEKDFINVIEGLKNILKKNGGSKSANEAEGEGNSQMND